MSNRLVTVATFSSPVDANLARNRLEAASLDAFLVDEESVTMAWHLANALGGIKLQVAKQDADAALAVLAEDNVSTSPSPGSAELALPSPPEADTPPELVEEESDELEPTDREQNAERALRGAILGLVVLPVQLYVFWLLLKVFVSNERLGRAPQRHALAAAAINLPLMLCLCIYLRMHLSA